MLILSRKQRETIRIGDSIEISVTRIGGNRVTLAITAPKDVKILRGEQFDTPPEDEATEQK